MPPVAPMLAKATRELPEGDFIYEPKWDGFRAIVFRDGDDVEVGSRNERPLTRYFPDIVAAVRANLPERCVVDGEIVVAGPSGLDFDALSQRIHPAASRVRMLAQTVPASLVAFDLLALDHDDLRNRPFAARRDLLMSALSGAGQPVHLTPATQDRAVAADWFSRFEGAGLDGVVAKPADLPYLEDRRVMAKVKHERTAEFVVTGFRWYRSGGSGESVGSLLLGLYDGDQLVHVGVIGSFPAEQRKELVGFLAPYREGPANGVSGPPSRWNAGKDLSFERLRPELVVEAAFEHLQGRRLRHTARFRRWRPDREPSSATFEQLDVAVPAELAEVFSAVG
jgi:bifunctional non-homologous end joining protein LigD